jgi:putative ABC transport system permease protein
LIQDFIKKIDTAGRQFATDADMASMVMFMNTKQSRLIKLTALEGDFPFYGELDNTTSQCARANEVG